MHVFVLMRNAIALVAVLSISAVSFVMGFIILPSVPNSPHTRYPAGSKIFRAISAKPHDASISPPEPIHGRALHSLASLPVVVKHRASLLKSSTLESVRAVVAEQLEVDKEKVQAESNLMKDLGADSLDSVELIMALEEKFNVTIPDEEATNIKTVQQAVDYIDKYLKEVAK